MSSGQTGTRDPPSRPDARRAAVSRIPPAHPMTPGTAAPGRFPAPGAVGRAHTLQGCGEASRRADLARQLHLPDIDPRLPAMPSALAPPRPRSAAVTPPAAVGALTGSRDARRPGPALAQLVGYPAIQRVFTNTSVCPVLQRAPGDQVEDVSHLLSRFDGRASRRATPGQGRARGGGRGALLAPRRASGCRRLLLFVLA